jgi:ketosteroid isomerase-like protein
VANPQTGDMAGMRQGIDETNRMFERAFHGGEGAAAAREVYTANATILPPGAAMVQGRENIARFWLAAQEGIKRVELSTLHLEPMGDGAYEIGQASLALADGQQVQAKYVVVWKHEEGRWRWHVDIWNT